MRNHTKNWLARLMLTILIAGMATLPIKSQTPVQPLDTSNRLTLAEQAQFMRTAGTAAPHFVPEAKRATKRGYLPFLSPHHRPIALSKGLVFVANTPAGTVDVIHAETREMNARISVGVEPVSIAVRPDQAEIWVANHVSDSISVIDNEPANATYLQVIATIQDIDPRSKATRFDEPVGIAFAGNSKAYVALSTANQVAIIDIASRTVTGHLPITAQDPRAIAVQGDRLYVLPFESNNQTQLSGGSGPADGDLVTFNARANVDNVLSLGIVVDIIKNPRMPDRDLFVFDTQTDRLIEVVDTLGTMLYGVAVSSSGDVFIAQTDARNDANGRAGTRRDGLADMENRAFLNRISRVDFDGNNHAATSFFDLEPLPPNHPAPDNAYAVPYAIAISGDDNLLVASAAGSDKILTIDPRTGTILGSVVVDAGPRGISLEENATGTAMRAWVLNALANTVSLVNLHNPSAPRVLDTISLDDPTDPIMKRGRILFNDAKASTTGTFSCGSCHPDGHTDQLIWVLDTPITTRGHQIQPRITMPIRGLRDTEPFHWDGIPGDPYGGRNSANVFGSVPPNAELGNPLSATRHLVDGSLGSTMIDATDTSQNDEGKRGLLSSAERDDLAAFILNVPYPPAPGRAFDNELSVAAKDGFRVFHVDGISFQGALNTCGNCHRMPFWVSTNTPGTGMEAPTWRGAYDRWLVLPQGRWNMVDVLGQWVQDQGIPERNMWIARASDFADGSPLAPVWDMVLEGSTGFAGAYARQITFNPGLATDEAALELLGGLEQASAEGAILFEGTGRFENESSDARLRFEGGLYITDEAEPRLFTRAELIDLTNANRFTGTFTGQLGANASVGNPQPAVWSQGPMEAQRGFQVFPTLTGSNNTMILSGRHIQDGARVYVNGRRVPGSVDCRDGAFYDCDLTVTLGIVPPQGMHFLQIQNPDGLFSNDYIFRTRRPLDRSTRWLPHITANNGGFETTLTITNGATSSGTAILQAYNLDGEQLPSTAIALPPNGFRQSSMEDLFPGQDVSHLSIDADSGLSVTAAYRQANGQSSTAHVNETKRIDTRFTIFPGDWNQTWDGMALINLHDSENRVRAFQLAENGTVISQVTLEENLAPYAKSLAVFGEHFQPSANTRLRIETDHPVAITFLRGSLTGFEPSALYPTEPLPEPVAGERFIPHVTPVGGAFDSTVFITNESETNGSVTLHPSTNNGASLTPRTIAVPAGASIIAASAELFPDQAVSHLGISGSPDCQVTIGYRAATGEGAIAHAHEQPVNNQGTSTYTLYQGDWSSEFDGMALVNLGQTNAEITVHRTDHKGKSDQDLLLTSNISPNAKYLLVLDTVLQNEPDRQITITSNQPSQIVLLRGTQPGANVLYPIAPVPLFQE